ncbi:MAG: lipid IV(A) 3-deoxy-D-manno-octulosonic acid transferase [Pseudomonadota bacterium]
MWFRLYAVLMTLLTPLMLAYFIWRGRKDSGYRQHLKQRLGRLPYQARWQGGLLIHTVSVGETLAARSLIESLLARFPNLPVTISCMTPTARRLIEQHFGDQVRCVFIPLDTPGCCKRFLKSCRPQAVWLMETELWPVFLDNLAKRSVPVALLNARLSAKSAAGYRRFSGLTDRCWRQLEVVCAQSRASALRMRALGVAPERLFVDGNLKFDISISDAHKNQAAELQSKLSGRAVWLCASTHPGEHESIIEAFNRVQADVPNLLLIIAPRHPEQFEAVTELLSKAGLSFCRRNTIDQVTSQTEVVLADSIGEMSIWATLASVSFVGGSLIERGGHNPLELIAGGAAVVTGPSVFNFTEVYRQLSKVNGVRWVDDCCMLADQVAVLLTDARQRNAQNTPAQQVLTQHKGATERMLEHARVATLTGSSMVKTKANGKEFIKFDEAILPECESKHFSAKYWQQRKAIAGNSTGRSTVWFIQQDDHGMLLRHYYRGGLVGKVNKDRFLREPAERSRAVHEFDLLTKLQDLGLPVPKPIAARMLKTGLFSYQADILVEVIPGAVDVFRLLRERSLTADNWQQLGAAVKKLHDHNVFHSDLNCHNLMFDDTDKAWVVDFDKCGFKEPGEWKKENIARLKRSLLKEKNKYDRFYWKESRDWPEFLTGYEKTCSK